MNSDALLQVKRDPPLRGNLGFVGLLVLRLRIILTRFFAPKHPGNFDVEFGTWLDPDYNLVPNATTPPPRPLVNKDCDTTYLVYNCVFLPAARCTFAGQLIALQQATNEVAQFLRDQFRCEDPDCLQETGETVWIGLDCSKDPVFDIAAILVRFRCVPEG